MAELSAGHVALKDFYQGCVYLPQKHLFLIGFARPIIGNIPSISEIQARYAVGLLAGKYRPPKTVEVIHRANCQRLIQDYPAINSENVYPVEQFPYCDELAKEMGTMPSIAKCGFNTWLKINCYPQALCIMWMNILIERC
ncbi:MAG: hypothetical protein R2880_11875 [Deinococcales bacterium]